MRVTSDIWVHVFVRREANRGAFAALVKRGAIEAGAIYIVENLLDETHCVYGPAPQSLIGDETDDRKFETVLSNVPIEDVETYLARQKNFDPDIWIVETECRSGPPSIVIAENVSRTKIL